MLAWAMPPALAQSSLAKAVEERLGTAVEIAGQPAPKRRLSDVMAGMHVPGVSVAVMRDGRLVWARGYGTSGVEAQCVTPETLFQAGSISKPVSMLAMLRLVANGRISPDAPVNDYLRRWSLSDSEAGRARDVTLRRLLAHVGGTGVHGFPGYPRDVPVPSLIAILEGDPPAKTAAVRIVTAPGSRWQYSGGGYVIAQLLAEDVTGRSFAEWAADEWLRPAGMSGSRFDVPAAGSAMALGHGADGRPVPGGYHLYPEAAAAGLWSTPSDIGRGLLAWHRAIQGDQDAILPRAIAREVLMPLLPGHVMGFDAGGSMARRWVAKGGDTEGFAGYLVFYPGKGDGAVVMTNGAQGATLARDIVRAIAIIEAWPDFGPRVRHASRISETLLGTLPGTYVYRGSNRFTIARKGKGLAIASPGEAPEALYLDPSGELFTLSQDATFVFDETPESGHIRIGDNTIDFRREAE